MGLTAKRKEALGPLLAWLAVIAVTRTSLMILPDPLWRWLVLEGLWTVVILLLLLRPTMPREASCITLCATGQVPSSGGCGWTGVGVGLAFAALSVIATGPATIASVGGLALPAALCALYEAVFFFHWLRLRLNNLLSPLGTVFTSAAAYALYHLGYYGFGREGLDAFGLTVGSYFVAGVVMATLAVSFGALRASWPFMTAGALADFSRLGLTRGNPGSAVGVVAAVALGAVAVALYYAAAVKRYPCAKTLLSAGSPPSGAGRVPPSADEATHAASTTRGTRPVLDRRTALVLAVGLAGLLAFGLWRRLIVNDPVVVDPYFAGVLDMSRFVVPRDLVQDLLLRTGFVVYLAVPVVAFVIAHSLDRKDVVSAAPHRAVIRTVGLTTSWGAALTSGGIAAAFVAGRLVGVALNLGHLAAAVVLTVSSLMYAILNGALVALVHVAVPYRPWRWFILLLAYIFVFNWWMVYPLFSQYPAAGCPPTSPPELAAWLDRVWSRATPLYAVVPHYHYYMSLTATYLRHALDREFAGLHLAMLAAYASAAFLLAAWTARYRTCQIPAAPMGGR